MNSLESIRVGERKLDLYVSVPDAGPHPGVLLLHPWWGFNEFMQDICGRLAEAGYLVVAPDLYGGTVATTIEEAEAIESNLDGTRAVADIKAALEYLLAHPQRSGGLGLMGFSMGAFNGLEVVRTRSSDVTAAVLFYGTNGGDYAGVKTAVLGHFAEDDQFETPEDVDDFRDRLAAGDGSASFYTYPGTEHWFMEADRPEYDEAAADLAWSRTIEFFRDEL